MYRVEFARSAEKELLKLSDMLFQRITNKITQLQDDPRPHNVKKLQGREGYRVRVGDYRILYTIDDTTQTIIILSAAHRREVYR